MITRIAMVAALGTTLGLASCSANDLSDSRRNELTYNANQAMDEFRESPSVRRFLSDAYGYAIFPRVAKGAIGIGGARGSGLVYEQGRLIGNSVLTQATIGFSLGGQSFQELIVFEDEAALTEFIAGDFAFQAGASAAAGTAGANSAINYENGLVVFVQTNGGLIYDASIGGQNFDFNPIAN
ncbi:MAG: YSC84-related protein [Planctomycetota bacterium]